MDSKRQSLTPQKRSHEDVSYSRKGKVYCLKILLPDGTTRLLKIPQTMDFITVKDLAGRVRKEHEKRDSNLKKGINWNAQLCFVDDSDHVFRTSLKLTNLELNRVYNLRLDDGSQPAEIYENMWDLTPDTELLMELPEEYTFETALADLIDNSLQAVWSNGANEKRLISVEVGDDKISVVDTGPGMDSMSIEKWGKMGASLHRASKIQAIGGKPPYLKPAFGMFGYGGFIASMHLGRHTEVSSKTQDCKKVYMLRLERDALVSGSGSKRTWRTYGSLRDPMKDELELSPGGHFTKVDIFEPKMRSIDIRRLQCKLKDIYFPYIQCDELSKKGRTIMPIEFQVNGDDLAEIPGGEVAITNLNSCNGPEFVLQLRFSLNHNNATMTSSQGPSDEANARLRCVYLPVKEGKESIQSILETLKEDGYEHTEEYGSFSHVSCRRLGRLLPDARWAWLPFMDFRQRKGDRSQVLKRSCMRVKCFIETDAGFNPTPSKTNFAPQNPYTTALRNLGSRESLEKETGVNIEIRRDGRPLTLSQLDKQYQQWLLEAHDKYDEEVDCGTDEPVYIVNPIKTKELHTSRCVVRAHKALMWKGKSWKSGQRIKILKGACAGFHKNNVYATMEYILLEGFQGDAGGEAWIICRSIDTLEEDGCLLETIEWNPILDLRKSVSIHINVIDSGKCLAVDDAEWNQQLQKQHHKSPSSIEILNTRQCRELGIEVSLPDEREVCAGNVSPCEIVAVVRPATFSSGTASKHLDQKYVMKDNFEMSLAIAYSGKGKSKDESNIYSALVTPSSRRDIHGLYVFQPKCKSHPLFHKAGIYTFTLSIRDPSCQKCVVKVQVKASHEAHRWAPSKEIPNHLLAVGCYCDSISVEKLDKYDNQIPFLEVPEIVVKVDCTEGSRFQVSKCNPSTSSDKSALILKGLLIESSNLDNIRPSYDATLMLSLSDGSYLLDIPVKVVPGPVKHVTVHPEICERQLIPDHVIADFTLELFDAYRNHLQEKQKVRLHADGLRFSNGSYSLQKKVDAQGCIDLGGMLRVTAGYGRKVSLSVRSDGGAIQKEWQIEKRHLRTTSVIPESCFAGSKLENLEFEVVDPKGEVDVNFHDEDNFGESHTLVIKSQFVAIDESVKYVFRDGRCIVRAVPIPSEEGDFSFVVSHSRHSELQLTIKVRVELPIRHDLPPETDAGFNPTPSKTNFAPQNPYTTALRNLGSRESLEKETGVNIEIRRDGRSLTLSQLDKQYQQWLLEAHDKYDEEVDCGTDEPVYIVNPIKTKELHTSRCVVRAHKALMWKGKSWKSGQRIKILKGACAGFHKNNVYATMEYILLEGFQGDAGGEAWIICRSIDTLEEDGCLLETIEWNPILDLRKSVSIHINVIDSGKCLAVDDAEWNQQLQKQHHKSPSSIEILNTRQCRELGIEVSLPDEREVCAGNVSPCEIVAVVRPATFSSGTASKHLDQKYVMKDNFEMSLAIAYSGKGKSKDESNIYSALVTPSSRRDIHGLYVFQPKCKSHPLFHKAGIYTFTLSIRDPSCQKCVVKVQVKASHEAHRWAPSKEIPNHLLAVGCYCDSISVEKLDKYDNQIPFLEVPEIVVKVDCTEGSRFQVSKCNPSTSSDKSALILKGLLIESSNLDNIRPSYDATLMLSLSDGSYLLDIPVKVVPGPVKHVTVHPEICERQLIPDHVIADFTLELFDAYRNHLQEKQKVRLHADGLRFSNGSYSLQKKVDAQGCIDLGGMLRVTAGYGRKVSLSVRSDGGAIQKEWQIEKRHLRTTSVIPESCFAGSKLENLEFEVVDPKGEVDVNFHDEDNFGESHTLVIKSQFVAIDESVKYVFRDGCCIVRAVPIPSEEGDFSFVVSHSRHSELQLTIKVRVELPIRHDLPPEMTPLNVKHPSMDENIYALMDADAPMDAQMGYMSGQCHTPETNASSVQDLYYDFQSDLRSCLNFEKDLKNEICDLGLMIGQLEEKIQHLECHKSAIESELLELEVLRDQTHGTGKNGMKYGSPGKKEIIERIELLKTNSAASVVIELLGEDLDPALKSILGVVALLGTTPTLELSRIFAEYLGDEMLAVVCKSYKVVHFLESYEKNGRLNRKRALHMFATAMGKYVNGRYHVLCIEDISPCKVDKDLEGKLLLPNPTLPNGSTPAGFLGYAVNMIDIDIDHLDTKTDSGFSLRETLFYRLFGEAQVYKTREDMKKAISCIKDGAVSLDGGILRGNGAVSLGNWEQDIIFPIAVGGRNEERNEVVQRYVGMKLKLEEVMKELLKEKICHEKLMKFFKKKRDMYAKYFTQNQPSTSYSDGSVTPAYSCK